MLVWCAIIGRWRLKSPSLTMRLLAGAAGSQGLLTAWIAELFEKATKAEATKSSSPTAPAESSRVVTPDTAESAMAVVDAVFEGYKVSFALRETCSNSVMAPRVELTAPSAQGRQSRLPGALHATEPTSPHATFRA